MKSTTHPSTTPPPTTLALSDATGTRSHSRGQHRVRLRWFARVLFTLTDVADVLGAKAVVGFLPCSLRSRVSAGHGMAEADGNRTRLGALAPTPVLKTGGPTRRPDASATEDSVQPMPSGRPLFASS